MVITSDILNNQNLWWSNSDWVQTDQHLLSLKDKSYAFTRPEVEELSVLNDSINIIRGPRQVGKTTLLKSILEKTFIKRIIQPSETLYLSCETIDNYKELEETLFSWLKNHSHESLILLDEISFVKEWSRAILSFANQGLLQRKTVFITGSNSRDLKESGERLPGRRNKGKDIFLNPLSLKEIKTLKCFSHLNNEEIFELYLKVGGFPHAIRDYVINGQVLDSTYEIYRNWIIGDAARYNLLESILKQILFRVFETLSSRVSWKSLIETTSVKSHETALSYIEHLEDAFIANTLYCYDHNKRSENTAKAKKIYFIDPLIYYLAYSWKTNASNVYNWVGSKLGDNTFKGKIFEAVVVSHLKRLHRGLYYWYSTKTKQEVDILLPLDNAFKIYDAKLSQDRYSKTVLGQPVINITPQNIFNFI